MKKEKAYLAFSPYIINYVFLLVRLGKQWWSRYNALLIDNMLVRQ